MVYVLELSKPLGHSKYYIGYTENEQSFKRRLAHHRKGTGSTFCRAAVERGIELIPVVLMQGDRALERRLKKWKSGQRVAQRYANAPENIIRA